MDDLVEKGKSVCDVYNSDTINIVRLSLFNVYNQVLRPMGGNDFEAEHTGPKKDSGKGRKHKLPMWTTMRSWRCSTGGFMVPMKKKGTLGLTRKPISKSNVTLPCEIGHNSEEICDEFLTEQTFETNLWDRRRIYT